MDRPVHRLTTFDRASSDFARMEARIWRRQHEQGLAGKEFGDLVGITRSAVTPLEGGCKSEKDGVRAITDALGSHGEVTANEITFRDVTDMLAADEALLMCLYWGYSRSTQSHIPHVTSRPYQSLANENVTRADPQFNPAMCAYE